MLTLVYFNRISIISEVKQINMQAIILAAGMGKRLKSLTRSQTKCMVQVNGVALIDRLLHQLDKYELSRIVIVVGYEGRKLIDFIGTLKIKTQILFVENPIYYKTNNIYSLSLTEKFLCQDDTLLFESDLIIDDNIIPALLNDSRDTLALVDKYESWMDGTCVVLSENDDILEFVPGSRIKFENISLYYKTVNIYKFSKHFSSIYYVPFLKAYCAALGNNEYYEQVLKVITMLDSPEIKAKRLNGELWYEIDDIQDLDIASSLFNNEDERIKLLQSRYGGYWRYPKLLDFCYLVNPYFPPQRLLDEIKANFNKLVTQYPSGARVNCLLASKNFNINFQNIVVGNGAAELIKSLMGTIRGKVGIIRPTFEEYPNRYEHSHQVVFIPNNSDFSYSVTDIMDFYNNDDISTLIIINPDNPSGNYISKDDMMCLIKWTSKRNIKLIVDESFVDFADDNFTLIEQSIIDKYSNLCVVKSISKSYGVPGLRLGVLVSGDAKLIEYVKSDVSIWNINSFAEFYMQIAEKYNKDYMYGLVQFRNERKRFVAELQKLYKYIRVIPSQANYLMLELLNGLSSKILTKVLLNKHNILIKDLSSKINSSLGQYVRIAIRSPVDNNRLLNALKQEIQH